MKAMTMKIFNTLAIIYLASYKENTKKLVNAIVKVPAIYVASYLNNPTVSPEVHHP